MGLGELLLIAIGLSMDAFAVSLCKGLNMDGKNLRNALIIAMFFGVFQGLMPLIGWSLGLQFKDYISNFDHWIAFILLGLIGGKMLLEGLRKETNLMCEYKLDIKELFFLAVATSIDALAVGVTFAFLKVSILPSIILIGITTFFISVLGVIIGHRFGVFTKDYAEIAGGIILILIGVKILTEHLGLI